MPTDDNQRSTFQALGLAWELGYTIAIPLVIFALAGRFLDRALGTSPWLLVAGVIVSIALTTWLVYRKTLAIVGTSSSSPQPQVTPGTQPPKSGDKQV